MSKTSGRASYIVRARWRRSAGDGARALVHGRTTNRRKAVALAKRIAREAGARVREVTVARYVPGQRAVLVASLYYRERDRQLVVDER